MICYSRPCVPVPQSNTNPTLDVGKHVYHYQREKSFSDQYKTCARLFIKSLLSKCERLAKSALSSVFQLTNSSLLVGQSLRVRQFMLDVTLLLTLYFKKFAGSLKQYLPDFTTNT